MNEKNKLSSNDEFILVSKHNEYKKINRDDLISHFENELILLEKSSSGTKGNKGQKGEKGNTGATGLNGYQGMTGQSGPFGDYGEDGQKGQKGEVGDAGLKGNIGLKGLFGIDGSKGSRGDFGDIGEKGSKGTKGEIGEKGEDGEKGYAGLLIKGIKGRKGVKGLGRQGTDGEKGQKGESGETGEMGEKGYLGFSNNIILESTDLNSGSWITEKSNVTLLGIRSELNSEYSRKIIKIRRGRYYNRFILYNTTYCEIGTQLNDPLRNCYSSFSHLIYDTVNEIEIPFFILTEESNKIKSDGSDNTLVTENFIVCRIFYDDTSKKIPFSVYVTDKM